MAFHYSFMTIFLSFLIIFTDFTQQNSDQQNESGNYEQIKNLNSVFEIFCAEGRYIENPAEAKIEIKGNTPITSYHVRVQMHGYVFSYKTFGIYVSPRRTTNRPGLWHQTKIEWSRNIVGMIERFNEIFSNGWAMSDYDFHHHNCIHFVCRFVQEMARRQVHAAEWPACFRKIHEHHMQMGMEPACIHQTPPPSLTTVTPNNDRRHHSYCIKFREFMKFLVNSPKSDETLVIGQDGKLIIVKKKQSKLSKMLKLAEKKPKP